MSEKTNYKVIVISAIVTAVVTVIATLAITKIIEYSFPSNSIKFDSELYKTSHLKKIKDDLPPMVYTLEKLLQEPAKKQGIFSKRETNRYFKLSIANLSKTELNKIDIKIKSNVKCSNIIVTDENRQVGLTKQSKDNESKLLYSISQIRSATGINKIIIFTSEAEFTYSDFEISVECAEGMFVKIPLSQYNDIGWK